MTYGTKEQILLIDEKTKDEVYGRFWESSSNNADNHLWSTSDPKALLMQYSVSNQYQDPSDWRTLLTECVFFLVYSAFVVTSTLICVR